MICALHGQFEVQLPNNTQSNLTSINMFFDCMLICGQWVTFHHMILSIVLLSVALAPSCTVRLKLVSVWREGEQRGLDTMGEVEQRSSSLGHRKEISRRSFSFAASTFVHIDSATFRAVYALLEVVALSFVQ